jgi:hypothetical protein
MLRRIEMNSTNHPKLEEEKNSSNHLKKLRRDDEMKRIKILISKVGREEMNSSNPLKKLKRDEINQEHNINSTFSKY